MIGLIIVVIVEVLNSQGVLLRITLSARVLLQLATLVDRIGIMGKLRVIFKMLLIRVLVTIVVPSPSFIDRLSVLVHDHAGEIQVRVEVVTMIFPIFSMRCVLDHVKMTRWLLRTFFIRRLLLLPEYLITTIFFICYLIIGISASSC